MCMTNRYDCKDRVISHELISGVYTYLASNFLDVKNAFSFVNLSSK